jgi:hypothetical protein
MGEDTARKRATEKAARDWTLMVDSQRGIVGRPQTRQVGISGKAVRHRLESGQWRRVHRGVYAAFTGEVSREAKLWAALQRAGAGAMLSHETAAELHGLTDRPGRNIHITVPHSRRPAQQGSIRGVVVHRSDVSRPQPLPEWVLPRTRVEDTILDLVANASTFDDAYAWVSRAVAERLVTVGMLRAALNARRRMRWRGWLTDALADAEDGAQFPLERRYLHDVERAHGLPKAERQARSTIGGRTHYKDNLYAKYGICVEIDGPTYHRAERVQKDKDRDNLNLAADGIQTYRFGPVNVTERACESAAMVAESLQRNGWRGQPHPCLRPGCTVGNRVTGA